MRCDMEYFKEAFILMIHQFQYCMERRMHVLDCMRKAEE